MRNQQFRVVCAALFVCSACGGRLDSAASQEESAALAACNTSPASVVQYDTSDELNDMLLQRWRRCGSVQARGEDVGVEFATDGRWYALTRDGSGNVIRRQGIDYGGTWQYFPVGSFHPISRMPAERAFLELDGGITDPPTFTDDPRQMRITFTPVLSRYVPLDP